MNKKVLIISSTPRKGGNSDKLCDAFAEGAKEAGNEVEKVRIADLKIGYCTGCYACQKTGKCAIKDDARGVIDKMMATDVIVLASPVYFYSICAQLKALIDRTVVVYPNLTNKRFYYLLTMADTDREKFDGPSRPCAASSTAMREARRRAWSAPTACTSSAQSTARSSSPRQKNSERAHNKDLV